MGTSRALASAVLLWGTVASGWAQDVTREIKATAGKEIRLTVVYSLRPDCTAAPLNPPKLKGEPANGRVRVARGTAKTNAGGKCPPLQIPVFVVFYRPNPQFSGVDEVVLEVETLSGGLRQMTFKVDVTGARSTI
jgi:hypothetical protein